MNYLELKNVIEQIVGSHLSDINRSCEMLMFHFGNYAIHAQCLTRIIKNNDILVTTQDFQSWDGKHQENNDEWYNLDKYRTAIEKGSVTSIELSPFFDLIITLDNDVTIQILIQNSYAHYDEEKEQYRFFEIGENEETEEKEKIRKHYVIYSKHIEID